MGVSLDAHQVGLSTESQKSEMYCLYKCICYIYCGISCCSVQNVSTRGHKPVQDSGHTTQLITALLTLLLSAEGQIQTAFLTPESNKQTIPE